MSVYALKWLSDGGVGLSGFSWPLPSRHGPGDWVEAHGRLSLANNGIHAATLEQSLDWLNDECYVIELDGKVIGRKDKMLAARRGRLIRQVTRWNERNARLFAADCAEHVLPFFESKRPHDDRPRKAIKAARGYARGLVSKEELAQVRDDVYMAVADDVGAWPAFFVTSPFPAWTVASDTAWAAAGVGAWSKAFEDANTSEARATRAAERKWQASLLAKYLKVPEVQV